MEPYSTLEATTLPAGAKPVVASAGAQLAELYPEQAVQPTNSNRTVQASVSAALAAARAETKARLAASNPSSGVRFPGEDGGHSLAEMAQRDLDAALQLLADRAQYITGASGAAIALRRNGKKDMLCRASTGSNAPELGALLSTEFGLSGESVRTRQPLRCDDAERDARVNRDVCREMGIASVVVMPVVNDDEVLGVFELFSGKTNAFGARDLSAIQRLSEMVETAVRLAQATESLPERLKMPQVSESEVTATAAQQDQVLEGDVLEDILLDEPVLEAPVSKASVSQDPISRDSVPKAAVADKAPVTPAKKPLFWSAALNPAADAGKSEALDQSHVPPVLRSLHKCEACGFPVSAGRALCVECEEKKWRGQLRTPKPSSKPETSKPEASKPGPQKPEAQKSAHRPIIPAAPASVAPAAPLPVANESKAATEQTVIASSVQSAAAPETTIAAAMPEAASPEFVLSSGLEPSQSWLARNKYIVGVLLAVGAAAAGFFLLR
jgi:GAF domain